MGCGSSTAAPVAGTRTSSVSSEEPVAWKAPAGAPYHRLTKIPIKPGTMTDIVKATQTEGFKATMAGFKGFKGVEALYVDESTMLTHSRWESEEACNSGAQALGTVLKEHLSAYIAGPPSPPSVGPLAMTLACGEGVVKAYRMVIMSLKPDKMTEIIAAANSKHAAFKAIPGLVSVSSFAAGPQAAVVFSGYTSKAELEAATPTIMPIMKEMGAFFAAPPDSMLTEVKFSTYDPAAAADVIAMANRPSTGSTINIAYVVPKDKADEVEAVFGKHSAWMTTFYAGSTEHLISCYFTKAPEFKVPTDPSQGETDNMIFTINEEFTAPESVGRHIQTASGNDYFPQFGEILGTYGKVVQPMGSVYFKLDSSRASGPRPATGSTINITYVVPKDKADEVEAVFGKHSAWMTTFYAGSTEHLISCYFTKAPEFKVPTDPSQGETDNMIFTINEEFTAPESVGRHIQTASGNDYFPQFGEILGTYGKVVQPMGSVYFKIR